MNAVPGDVAGFAATCRFKLTENVLPFWLKRGWDREHGGAVRSFRRIGVCVPGLSSAWRRTAGGIVLTGVVPPGTTARLRLTGKDVQVLIPGQYELTYHENH